MDVLKTIGRHSESSASRSPMAALRDSAGSVTFAIVGFWRKLRLDRIRRKRRVTVERDVLRLALLTGLPGVVACLVLLIASEASAKLQWTVMLLVVGFWLGFAFSLRERVVRPIQSLSNLLAAIREGDYSIRARGAGLDDAMGEALFEVNALSETLREQRLGAMEATTLLRTVISEIDVAIFAFDFDKRLRLLNRAGERFLGRTTEAAIGQTADELGLDDCLEGDPVRTIESAAQGGGRWSVRRGAFREGGRPHHLLVVSDLSRELREEERLAWRRIIRVIGHELNNSLAPIKSIAASLESLLAAEHLADDWRDDARRGLSTIGSRAAALNRFMQAYAALAKLPEPKVQQLDVETLVRRAIAVEERLGVVVRPGPLVTVQADGDQLEQALINLIRNAADAVVETDGGVVVGWTCERGWLELFVEDDGLGIANTANLFVPFFTTKPGGSGIGLVLSRQIVEAHGGTLTLENRADARGCVGRLRLPVTR
jgi:nitrogen fixation/metabolism regulation signal transduction histidine kinase